MLQDNDKKNGIRPPLRIELVAVSFIKYGVKH